MRGILVGEAPFFVDAKRDNEEPQNVAEAFNGLILSAWRESNDICVPRSFVIGLLDLLETHSDTNLAIYIVCDWVWFYCFCANDKRERPNGVYTDLFDVDLEKVACALRESLENNRDSLTLEKRWAGADWNSPDGLWTPLVRQAMAVRDQLGGVDFVPRVQRFADP